MPKLPPLFTKLSRWLLPALGLVAIFVVLSAPVFAAEPATDPALPQKFTDVISDMFNIASFGVMIITLLAYVFAFIVGDLIDSTYILDSGMGDTLHLVWSVMRNFVNIGFILVLLIIAAMVVFGGGGDKGLGMLKKVLPKFILALVFVNFTFFAGRFILTTNDVLASAIFSLPKTVSGEHMLSLPCADGATPEECRASIGTTVGGGFSAGPKLGADTKDKVVETIGKLNNVMTKHRITDVISKKNVTLLLLSSMVDLQKLTETNGIMGGKWDVAISGIGALVTAGAVAIVIFMLMFALVVRMVVLWMCLALSPVAALAIVLGDVIPGANMKGDFDLLSIFIKHAFMPTLVAIPLSIGLIMIFANNHIAGTTGGSLGSFGGAENAGNFNTFLWWIASIVIIWFGTNAMIKKSSEYASKITDKIHSGVNSAASTVAGTLKYAPILPSWNGGADRSLASYTQIPRNVSSLLESQSSAEAAKDSKVIASSIPGYHPQKMEQSTFSDKMKTVKVKGVSELIRVIQELITQGLTSDSKVGHPAAEEIWKDEKNRDVLMQAGIKSVEELAKQTGRSILDKIKTKYPQLNEQVDPALKGLDKNDADFQAEPSDESSAKDKEKIEGETSVKSENAGKTFENKDVKNQKDVEKGDGKKVEVSGKVLQEVTVTEDGKEKTMYATQNDDGKGWTIVATKEEFVDNSRDLKEDIKGTTEAKDAEALAERIKKLVDVFGDNAVDEIEKQKLEFKNEEVSDALISRLLNQHRLAPEKLEKIVGEEKLKNYQKKNPTPKG